MKSQESSELIRELWTFDVTNKLLVMRISSEYLTEWILQAKLWLLITGPSRALHWKCLSLRWATMSFFIMSNGKCSCMIFFGFSHEFEDDGMIDESYSHPFCYKLEPNTAESLVGVLEITIHFVGSWKNVADISRTKLHGCDQKHSKGRKNDG